MRIARALAAAALTFGLASTLTPAQAAPAAPPVVQVVDPPVQATAAMAKTKVTVKASSRKTKVGKTVKFTGKLTRKRANGHYKPLAKGTVGLYYPVEEDIKFLGNAETSKKGTYTIKLKPEKWMVGEAHVYVVFDGLSTSESSASKFVKVKVTKK